MPRAWHAAARQGLCGSKQKAWLRWESKTWILEDQKRRDGGPPRLQSWHSAQEKGGVSAKDAACYRASVDTDPANDLEPKREACWTTKTDEPRKLKTDQQFGLEEDGAPDQGKVNGYGDVLILWSLLGRANTYSEIWICTYSRNLS